MIRPQGSHSLKYKKEQREGKGQRKWEAKMREGERMQI